MRIAAPPVNLSRRFTVVISLCFDEFKTGHLNNRMEREQRRIGALAQEIRGER
jgi:hypothetical protein